jgi:hypothetical protein
MPGRSRVRGANRGSGRVQSAPGEPFGWYPGAKLPLIPVAGRNGALENLRSIISATYLPLAISALVAAVGAMGMVHPVLLTQMLVVACGAPCAAQLLNQTSHVLPAVITRRNSTTSASDCTIFPLFPWSNRGLLHGAAPMAAVPVSAGASPADTAVRDKTGAISGHGGSRTTANGQLFIIPSPERGFNPLIYPPYNSQLH